MKKQGGKERTAEEDEEAADLVRQLQEVREQGGEQALREFVKDRRRRRGGPTAT